LEIIISAAAPLGIDVEAAVKAKFKTVKIGQGYTMTELPHAVVYANKNATKPGSVGMLLPNCEAKVMSADGKTEMGTDQDGELWFKCPNMMKGYLNNEEATDLIIDKDLFLHTGDVGHFDCDGHLFIVGRAGEEKKGGVNPCGIEAYIATKLSPYKVLRGANNNLCTSPVPIMRQRAYKR